LEKSLSGVSKLWKVHRLDRENPAGGAFVDALVLDSYSPAAPGGTGQTVDWTAARAFVAASRTKVILAGGLTPENVAEGIRAVRPWGVDVSSGVEAQPGRKDLAAVKRFIETCRAN
jgi:phosphoribosylanthranilate isomerase